MKKYSPYAPVILRLGLAMVFIWFGMNQILNQSMWLTFIPDWASRLTGMGAATLVLVNGIFEVVFALLLAFGIQIRIVATLLFLHMILIVSDVGIDPVGVRDVGLMFALLSVALHGPDTLSVDSEVTI